MGLDCSHDAFHGAYSAFNRLRQAVAAAAGGSFPPHYVRDASLNPVTDPETGRVVARTDIPDNRYTTGPGYTRDEAPGLHLFLMHSDCDGHIEPRMCAAVADDLERLLPAIEAAAVDGEGHLKQQGGVAEALRGFIEGCRLAHSRGERLMFE